MGQSVFVPYQLSASSHATGTTTDTGSISKVTNGLGYSRLDPSINSYQSTAMTHVDFNSVLCCFITVGDYKATMDIPQVTVKKRYKVD